MLELAPDGGGGGGAGEEADEPDNRCRVSMSPTIRFRSASRAVTKSLTARRRSAMMPFRLS